MEGLNRKPEFTRRDLLRGGVAIAGAAALNISVTTEAQAETQETSALRAALAEYGRVRERTNSPEYTKKTLSVLARLREKLHGENPREGIFLYQDMSSNPKEFVAYTVAFLERHASDVENIWKFMQDPQIFPKWTADIQNTMHSVGNLPTLLKEIRHEAKEATSIPEPLFTMAFIVFSMTEKGAQMKELQQGLPVQTERVAAMIQDLLQKDPRGIASQPASSLISMMQTMLQSKAFASNTR